MAKIELPETVGEVTRPFGLGTLKVESIGLITGLADTGSDPEQSSQRSLLLEEMKKRRVEHPNSLLADPSTSIVLTRAYLPVGVRAGEPVDIEVRCLPRSKTSSLENGWLMETDLREVAAMNRGVHTGHIFAVAEGPVLVDALLQEGDDDVSMSRGRVLGGGRATQTRPIGLTLRSEHHSVSTSKIVGAAINRRFDTYVRGAKQGAAKPKTDNFVELSIHPRYRDNLIRYLRVVEQISLRNSPREELARQQKLEAELLVPATSALAALKLEAIGDDSVRTLERGLNAASAEVRFYAAEALAYLDQAEAAKHLGEASNVSAFRSRALLALGAMSSVEAHDQLMELLDVTSSETRYGAFRALQNMNPRDPVLGQEVLGSRVYYHQIASQGEPMVHVARTRRPEIVTFGGDQPLKPPMMVLAGKRLVVKSDNSSEIKITKYTPGQEDDTRVCRATVNELIRSLVLMEASYPDIVSVVQQAKQQGCLQARLVFDAIPKSGRTYDRDEDEIEEQLDESTTL